MIEYENYDSNNDDYGVDITLQTVDKPHRSAVLAKSVRFVRQPIINIVYVRAYMYLDLLLLQCNEIIIAKHIRCILHLCRAQPFSMGSLWFFTFAYLIFQLASAPKIHIHTRWTVMWTFTVPTAPVRFSIKVSSPSNQRFRRPPHSPSISST